MGHLLLTVKRVAQAGLNNGYRVVINTGLTAVKVSIYICISLGAADDVGPRLNHKKNKSQDKEKLIIRALQI